MLPLWTFEKKEKVQLKWQRNHLEDLLQVLKTFLASSFTFVLFFSPNKKKIAGFRSYGKPQFVSSRFIQQVTISRGYTTG